MNVLLWFSFEVKALGMDSKRERRVFCIPASGPELGKKLFMPAAYCAKWLFGNYLIQYYSNITRMRRRAFWRNWPGMYLFAFVLLLVGILGLYTEVFTVQAARIYGSQTGFAQTMMTWQNAAVGLVQANKAALMNANLKTAGCSLTKNLGTACSIGVLASANLPTGYNMTYSWDTYVYQPGGNGTTLYAITWAPPPISGTAVTTPPIGISLSDLYRQIQNDTNIPLLAYGAVSFVGGKPEIVTGATSLAGTVIVYNPLPGAVLNNSVAIVSVP
jgi:hypothetical protein